MSIASVLGDLGDACPLTSPAPAVNGSVTVLIGGMPATILGSTIANGSSVIAGSGTVLIEGLPAARVGDSTTCGVILGPGFPTVLIGG